MGNDSFVLQSRERRMRPDALIVEDDEPLSIVLRYNLEAEGQAVTAAVSAEEAELVIRASPPDLILLDWALPGRSGIALLLETSLARDGHIGILLLTAKAEDADRERGLAAGADVFLEAVFLEHLVSAIRSCLAPVRSTLAGMHAVEA